MKLFASLKQWAHRIKRDVIAVYFAARDPRTPWPVRMLAFAVAAYALSPIDLIPDFVPVLGYLDDALLLPIGIWMIVRLLPADVLSQSRARAEGITLSPRSAGVVTAIIAIWVICTLGVGFWLLPSTAFSADSNRMVAPIVNARAISGCAWAAWIDRAQPIFLAKRDDSSAIMNIDGSDVVLRVEGKSGPLPRIGDVIERRYSATDIEVKATYKVTSDCSKSANESCEVSGFSVTLQVKKGDRTQVIEAEGSVGC